MNMKLFTAKSIRAKTAELLHLSTAVEEAPTDERLELVQKVFNEGGSWGGHSESLRALINAITGYEIETKADNASPFIVGALVAFEVDGTTRVAMVYKLDSDGDGRIMGHDGEKDGYISKTATSWRAATEAEVEAWLIAAEIIEAPVAA